MKRTSALSPVLEWTHFLHALSQFYVLCWVIVLDWTVKMPSVRLDCHFYNCLRIIYYF